MPVDAETLKCPMCRLQSTMARIWFLRPGGQLFGAGGTEVSSSSAGAIKDGGVQVPAELQDMMIPFESLVPVKRIGSGGFGAVSLMRWQGSTDVAVKRLHGDEYLQNSGAHTDFLKEIDALRRLNHPNIIQMLGVTIDGHTLMLVTEYMKNGSLHDVLYRNKNGRTISWKARVTVALEVAKAMLYLHCEMPRKSSIAHLDLKPGNILIAESRKIKVADFGLCRMGIGTLATARSSDGQPGTVEYMAPEIYMGAGVGTAADVYSFGIIMWELCALKRPMLGFDKDACRRQDPKCNFLLPLWVSEDKIRPTMPLDCPKDWAQMIERCWQADPSERPRFSDIVPGLAALLALCERGSWPTMKGLSQPAPGESPAGPVADGLPAPEPGPEPVDIHFVQGPSMAVAADAPGESRSAPPPPPLIQVGGASSPASQLAARCATHTCCAVPQAVMCNQPNLPAHNHAWGLKNKML